MEFVCRKRVESLARADGEKDGKMANEFSQQEEEVVPSFRVFADGARGISLVTFVNLSLFFLSYFSAGESARAHFSFVVEGKLRWKLTESSS